MNREDIRKSLFDPPGDPTPISLFDASPYYQAHGWLVPDLPGAEWYSDRFYGGKGAGHLTRGQRILYSAIADCGPPPDGAVPERVGLIVGNTLGGMPEATAYYQGLIAGNKRFRAKHLPRFLAGSEAAEVARDLGWRGPVLAISSACASGLQALGLAAEMLLARQVDVVYAGGYEPYAEFTHAGFCSLQAVSRTTCRPFAATRDGMWLGEGAGLLQLQRAEDVEDPMAFLSGWGHSADLHHLTHPDPTGTGAAKAMIDAIRVAGMTPADITTVVAHATATPANDTAEATALREVLGAALTDAQVTALKRYHGHTLGAAGGVAAGVAIQMIRSRKVCPVGHDEEIDPACGSEFPVVQGGPVAMKDGAVMINAFGFGGMNGSVVLSRK
jgi:3-oxoacyl-[acyl-carrier-protein] synthase II